MVFRELLKRFEKKSPVSVMARAILENIFAPKFINEIFRDSAERQQEKSLLFSTIVDVMALVVGKVRPSVNAAYVAMQEEIDVSVKSVYNKIDGVEPDVSRSLVVRTGEKMMQAARCMGSLPEGPIPGYEVRIIDGNHHPASEHRLKPLRTVKAGPLPGKSLVVLDPQTRMVVDVYPCEDGHEQERSILLAILDDLEPEQVWIADRNFCTSWFLHEIMANKAFFVIRQHKVNVRSTLRGKRRRIGSCDTGTIYEEPINIHDDHGTVSSARRVTIVLNTPTRDGDGEIHILTNLPETVSAEVVAQAYRERWTIENVNGELKRCFGSELRSLGYPKATLFAFCVALVSYNIVALLHHSLRAAHGAEATDGKISTYYLCVELRAVWDGMSIAIDDDYWVSRYADLSPAKLAAELVRLAQLVRLKLFKKNRSYPKTPPPKRTQYRHTPHVSTFRILQESQAEK